MTQKSHRLYQPLFALLLGLVANVLAIVAAVAHPGHGHTDGNSTTHFLTEPEHVIGTVFVVSVLVVGLVALRRRFRKSR